MQRIATTWEMREAVQRAGLCSASEAQSLSPDDLEQLAARVFIEMPELWDEVTR